MPQETTQTARYYLDNIQWHRIDIFPDNQEDKVIHFIRSPDFYELLERFLEYSSECESTEELRQEGRSSLYSSPRDLQRIVLDTRDKLPKIQRRVLQGVIYMHNSICSLMAQRRAAAQPVS